jgi:DNA-binding SARP family transcriptional activator
MLRIQTFGVFRVWINDREILPADWTREKALHLFQLLITLRRKRPHREQLIDLLWPDLDPETGDRDFRVALNAAQNALEPERKPRAPSHYIIRSELNYSLHPDETWIDADAFEDHLLLAHHANGKSPAEAAGHYQDALALYQGEYLSERRYEDWSASERERLRTLALGTMTRLADMLLESDPLETLRLAQRALEIDPLWENAYRIEMQAHLASGNRPMAIRAYEACKQVLSDEYGLEPLPETTQLFASIA